MANDEDRPPTVREQLGWLQWLPILGLVGLAVWLVATGRF